ncbi:hypothetical protein L1049_018198 [Liquidambar formosana]|uniref:Uncharacterized protein n=1 Tax=Liquidambar formosana TaxID=63359 RepID=A0AAP0R9Q7_LIQFO
MENSSNPLGWKSFNMRAVVAATEDIFQFILSEKGLRVRVYLLRDIIKAADTFLEDEVVACIFCDNIGAKETSEYEGHAMHMRVLNGFQSLRRAVKLAPEVWTAMLIRLALRPEVHRFTLDIISALVMHLSRKIPETSWVCISRLLHKLVKNFSSDDL